MKRFPNQFSNFSRIRDHLSVIAELNADHSLDPNSDFDLGYALVRLRKITFRGFPDGATDQQLEARIAEEQLKTPSNQSPQTIARDSRRALRELGWLDDHAELTYRGRALLATEPNSYEEQALLVEGLLTLTASDTAGNIHHPVRTLLHLLEIHASFQREGLELALAPLDDSREAFDRIAPLYDLDRNERMSRLGLTPALRANAVKILPSLAVTAGLVIEEEGLYSLSQDGWAILGHPPQNAARVIRRRRGRRTTSGRKVSGDTVAARNHSRPPRTLSAEEQLRAANRLSDRTKSHQELVKRIYSIIGDDRGDVFEDEFSYDLLWVPKLPGHGAVLFEMKSVTSDTDAYARVRHAVGQLSYYEFFNVKPSVGPRKVRRVAAFDAPIPEPLVEYLTHEGVAVLQSVGVEPVIALNPLGEEVLDLLRRTRGDA